MTYAEAQGEIERIEAEERADLERRLAARRGPDGMVLQDEHLTVDERAARLARSVVLFHGVRKRSRGTVSLGSGHPDGKLRWTGATPLEGGPNHPGWQARLAASTPLTEEEMGEDDWWVESYDPMDF